MDNHTKMVHDDACNVERSKLTFDNFNVDVDASVTSRVADTPTDVPCPRNGFTGRVRGGRLTFDDVHHLATYLGPLAEALQRQLGGFATVGHLCSWLLSLQGSIPWYATNIRNTLHCFANVLYGLLMIQ